MKDYLLIPCAFQMSLYCPVHRKGRVSKRQNIIICTNILLCNLIDVTGTDFAFCGTSVKSCANLWLVDYSRFYTKRTRIWFPKVALVHVVQNFSLSIHCSWAVLCAVLFVVVLGKYLMCNFCFKYLGSVKKFFYHL